MNILNYLNFQIFCKMSTSQRHPVTCTNQENNLTLLLEFISRIISRSQALPFSTISTTSYCTLFVIILNHLFILRTDRKIETGKALTFRKLGKCKYWWYLHDNICWGEYIYIMFQGFWDVSSGECMCLQSQSPELDPLDQMVERTNCSCFPLTSKHIYMCPSPLTNSHTITKMMKKGKREGR